MADRFHGKVVAVTEGASGIGEATARRFVTEGAKGAGRPRGSLTRKGGQSLPADQVTVQTADVSDSRAVDGMVAAVVRPFGRLDVIVNNAGVREDPASITERNGGRSCRPTSMACFMAAARRCPPRKDQGRARQHGVGLWDRRRLGMSPYNAAKGVVVNLTRALALDLGKKGIRVNAVCPSLTGTGMTEDMMDDKKLLAKFAERISLGGVCEPQEVAAVIVFLASDDASFMTSANVAVDGGVSASNGQPPQE
ncbi:SDR family NAD(P)-dependent oxidoreductase [Bradyrhizobium guangzhouense]|uniref:SDR family NAD(P)-dependent oxidoreductase n=2 Tax=Bradyrhizobium TaxID=374 RepID=UPI001009EF03|nr:SDR family oxidoreductase [Bradyrhizobium guangzhouense]RXH10611.1 SDR family oxidoreductase [Bradyrhizobium guangzhouense]